MTAGAPWKERMVFLRGLWNEQANNGVIHCMQTGNMLRFVAYIVTGTVHMYEMFFLYVVPM